MSNVVVWRLVDESHPRFNTWEAFSLVTNKHIYKESFPKGVNPNLYASGASEDAVHDSVAREESEKGFRAIMQARNEKIIKHNDKYGVREDIMPYGRGKKKGHVKKWLG